MREAHDGVRAAILSKDVIYLHESAALIWLCCRRPMSKRELKRLEKLAHHSRFNVMYITGSFVIGTALCGGVAYATWTYTKMRMGVKDGKEYAEKMRALTPSMKKEMDESVIGRSVRQTVHNFSKTTGVRMGFLCMMSPIFAASTS